MRIELGGRLHRTALLWAVLMLGAALLLAACGDDDDADAAEDDRPLAVTTVAPLTSIAQNIAGTRIAVEGVIPDGVDSHTFEPPPSVAVTLAEADLVILNGLFLEEPTLQMAEANMRDGAELVLLADNTVTEGQWVFDFSFPEDEGLPNPHLWTDPLLALRYAELIEEAFARLDPDGADEFAANLAAFRERIEDLDARIRDAVATVPEGQRVLLTYHDSWPYFADRYGFTVLGAIQPSDFSEPSPSEVGALIDQVRDLQVPAIFGSEVFPSAVLETIARESGAEYYDDLSDDELPGSAGDPGNTYLGMMLSNMQVMIGGLGGSIEAFDGFDTGPVLADE